jgi:hypothetical protein
MLSTSRVVFLVIAAALAVVVFFWNRADRDLWKCVIAPAIGFIGLAGGSALAIAHYDVLTQSRNALINTVPVLLLIAAVAGVAAAIRLRRARPAVYAGLAASQLRRRTEKAAAAPPPASYSRTYCLVGGGPAGMIMARALIAEGVPFDWFEHPMPANYPDYPGWQQIKDYVQGFAARYGLYGRVTLGVSVERAQAQPEDRWLVTLSTGEQRTYDGLIAAPGVTWHPNVAQLPGSAEFSGEIRHSASFRDGTELRGRRVLIVGAGNSGADIAADAARHASAAYLSVRRGYRFIPKHVFGLPTDAVMAGLLEPPAGISLPADRSELVDLMTGDLTRLGLPKPDHDVLSSHPIMNSQVLHYLAHGDLVAKPDVTRLTPSGALFADGSQADVDLVLLATGYDYRLPFLEPDLLTWDQGRPQLYLNVFARERDSLYVLGFVEFADAAYRRFDEMARLIIMDIRARETGVHRAELQELKRTDQPDLRGGVRYIDSPRHVSYVEIHAYTAYLAGLRDRFDWPDLDESSYSALRTDAVPETAGVPG